MLWGWCRSKKKERLSSTISSLWGVVSLGANPKMISVHEVRFLASPPGMKKWMVWEMGMVTEQCGIDPVQVEEGMATGVLFGADVLRIAEGWRTCHGHVEGGTVV